MRKTLGKPGFTSGEDRRRTTAQNAGKMEDSCERAAKSGALAAPTSHADFLRVRWPGLTDQAVRRITSLIEAELRERD
jgi:hypothetical protein